MFAFLILALIFTLIGGVLLWRDNRNFIGGVFLGMGAIIGALLLLMGILVLLDKYAGQIGQLISIILVILLIPGTALFLGIYLIRNTQVMRTREGLSVVALLSAGLGLNVLIILPIFLKLIDSTLPFWITKIGLWICLVDLTLLFVFAAYLAYSWFYQMVPLKGTIDYIIVLGAGIRSEEVTPLLKSRLDKGLQYYHANNDHPTFVVSGGQGPDEPVSEAFAMAKYLRRQGVPEAQILLEDQSTTTYENMQFSKAVLLEHDADALAKNIIFSTNNYHVLRSAGFARQVQLPAQGVGAPISLYYLPSALIREYIGLLVQYKYWTLLVCFGWAFLLLLAG